MSKTTHQREVTSKALPGLPINAGVVFDHAQKYTIITKEIRTSSIIK
ncbi:MAG: hypothetical protein QF632_05375 [Candidatus Woesearchaeota archaeon]|nr:hypothetical protein [Candidatus Woesearchaeota archaeon]MDP7324161.1 hypothetical protein [Candidatus Woesearchaeota archaeon]MDP7457389.1 hypothetical protein [Candidatus Woesearchaeota archaeon]